jgi:hypothetical protein
MEISTSVIISVTHHYLASSQTVTVSKILLFIGKGACVRATNTLGQTFVHVLNLQFWLENEFIELVKHLTSLCFPFAQRDYVRLQLPGAIL